MDWLLQLDQSLFKFINLSLSNRLLDGIMPFFSDNPFYVPLLVCLVVYLLWKGGARGRLCTLLIILSVALGDELVYNTCKQTFARLRPFKVFPEAHLLVGKGSSFSMPSSHAANWFAALSVTLIYYRRSWVFMLPLALLVSFSRIYNGVHYPADVMVGALLGAGTGAAFAVGLQGFWSFVGRRWFPLWWASRPNLLQPDLKGPAVEATPAMADRQWLHLGYLITFVLLAIRLAYLAAGKLELSEDEAYQWLWSKHLALSYYSKPLLIAYTQFLGTSLWGDTPFGVRFFSPLIGAALSLVLLHFITRMASARAGVVLLIILSTTPLMAVGTLLMTIDPLSVLFWTAAMVAGWKAIQPSGTTRDWAWVGFWMGFGFLSKYTNLFQLLCWVVFLLLYPAARVHLRRPGPYVALLINGLFTLPVVIWNTQNHWITIKHVANDGHLDKGVSFSLASIGEALIRNTRDFLLVETFLLNPFYFLGAAWVAVMFWRHHRQKPLFVYLFSMGAPLFLFYLVFTLQSRVLPNWIAPSVVPMLCLFLLVARDAAHRGARWPRRGLIAGAIFGLVVIVPLHETELLAKLIGRKLPPKYDILRRVRGWEEMARIVEAARVKLAAEGKPTFIIGNRYQITGQLAFNIPAAKADPHLHPLVYFMARNKPENQFFFWDSYGGRRGDNAIFARQVSDPELVQGWFGLWLRGRKANLYVTTPPEADAPPKELQRQFSSVTDLGIHDVRYRNKVYRRIQLFACRDLQQAP